MKIKIEITKDELMLLSQFHLHLASQQGFPEDWKLEFYLVLDFFQRKIKTITDYRSKKMTLKAHEALALRRLLMIAPIKVQSIEYDNLRNAFCAKISDKIYDSTI